VKDPFLRVAAALGDAKVRYCVIGVWGANYYTSGSLFVTHDQDLFVPPDAANLLAGWHVCEALGLELSAGDEPLDRPRDLHLAQAVTARNALTTATDGDLLRIDFTMVMGSFGFDDVWRRNRRFVLGGIAVPVAALGDIVAAKAAADRPKDRLFLATHAEELRKLLGGR
jgi:hypothetical protein